MMNSRCFIVLLVKNYWCSSQIFLSLNSITEFSLAQSVDEYLVSFFLKKMLSELGNYSRTYRDAFNDVANDHYLNLVESGQRLL